MEILKDGDSATPTTLISNIEVLQMLDKHLAQTKKQERRNRKHNRTKPPTESEWIQDKVHEYLQSTPCHLQLDATRMTELKAKLQGTKRPKRIAAAAGGNAATSSNDKASGFGLTEAESIQILNLMPQQAVEIHLMVEELHSRLSDARQQELLDLIASYQKSSTADTTQATEAAMEMSDGHHYSTSNSDDVVPLTAEQIASSMEPNPVVKQESNMSLDDDMMEESECLEDMMLLMADEPPPSSDEGAKTKSEEI